MFVPLGAEDLQGRQRFPGVTAVTTSGKDTTPKSSKLPENRGHCL